MNAEHEEFLDSKWYEGEGWKTDGRLKLYQRDILMLALWRAVKVEGDFRMATETTEMEKPDDIFFSGRPSPEDRWRMRFVHAKLDDLEDDAEEITEEDLLSDPDSQYYLPKYLESYERVKEGTKRTSKYEMFWDSVVEDVVVLSNRGLGAALKEKLWQSHDKDRLLDIPEVDCPQRAAFCLPKEFNEAIVRESNKTSDYSKLICELASAVSSGQPLPASDLVCSYALPLFNCCFTRTKEPGTYQITSKESFSNDYFYDDLMGEITFRNWAKLNQTDIHQYSSYKDAIESDTFKFENNAIPISDETHYIKLGKSIIKDFDIEVKDIDMSAELEEDFIEALKSADREELYWRVYVKSKIVRPLARSVIVTKHSYYIFSTKFFISENEDLPPRQRKLRDRLKKEKGITYSDLRKYTFEIEGEFKTWEDDALYKELPKPHTMEGVEEFRNIFKFYVNYPKEEELMEILTKIITRESGVDFIKNYSDEILSWMTEPYVGLYTKEKGVEFLDEVSIEELEKVVDSEKETHWSSYRNYDFKDKIQDLSELFKKQPMKSYNTDSDSNDAESGPIQIAIVECPEFSLGCLKLFKTIQSSPIEEKYVLTFLGKLESEMNQTPFELFSKVCDLLVVECDRTLRRDIFERIKGTLKRGPEKRAIFLVRPYNTEVEKLVSNSFQNKYTTYTLTAHLSDFVEGSIETLLGLEKVKFQEKVTCFNELFSNALEIEELNQLLSPESIEQLIFHSLKLGKANHSESYDRNTYIERSLVSSKNEMLPEKDLLNSTEKLILVSGYAGMGKSALLTSLALKCKDEHPLDWVVRLDCCQTCDTLERIEEGLSMWREIEYIPNYIKVCLDLAEREDLIFDKILELGNIRIYLDGVDEVSPKHFKLIMDILEELCKSHNIKQVTVSTREHLKVDIETRLEKFTDFKSYFLNFFTDNELTEYFVKKVYLNRTKDAALTKRYVEKIINNLKNVIPSDVLAAPLHTSTLATLFPLCQKTEGEPAEDFLRREMSQLTQELNGAKFNPGLLYDSFIKNISDIWSTHKGGHVNNQLRTDTSLRGVNLENIHTHYAIRMFLPEKICRNWNPQIEEQKLCKFGFIINLSPVEFIHRTFAEFFTAKYLFKELKDRNEVIEFVKGKEFLENKYEHIRAFLKKFIENEKQTITQELYNLINHL